MLPTPLLQHSKSSQAIRPLAVLLPVSANRESEEESFLVASINRGTDGNASCCFLCSGWQCKNSSQSIKYYCHSRDGPLGLASPSAFLSAADTSQPLPEVGHASVKMQGRRAGDCTSLRVQKQHGGASSKRPRWLPCLASQKPQ